MRRRTEVSEMLRPVVLAALLPMAEFEPDQVPWDVDLLEQFGDPDDADEGIPTLEITRVVISRAINPPHFPRLVDHETSSFPGSSPISSISISFSSNPRFWKSWTDI
jgi:hypothetical protein